VARVETAGVAAFDRAFLLRHLALCAAAGVAYVVRAHFQVGSSVLWTLGLAAVLNLAVSFLPRRLQVLPTVRCLSSLLALAGWSLLMLSTGGASSPFAAGLTVEILLAATAGASFEIALATGGAIAGLWAQQAARGLEGTALRLILQTGFLLLAGAVTAYFSGRWRRAQAEMLRSRDEVQGRLGALERELDDARRAGRLGEDVARLAHGLKNAIHSLRGFARLIEPRLPDSSRDRKLLDGLSGTIDGLEGIVRATIGRSGRPIPAWSGAATQSLSGAAADPVNQVVEEMSVAFPAIRWSVAIQEPSPDLLGATPVLREVLGIVVRNAAEAMDGCGAIDIEAAPSERSLEIRVRDHGPGLSGRVHDTIFSPGVTTKPDGHGLGLYIARRILEDQGGSLRLTSGDEGGTLCSIRVPLPEPRGAS
jgi:signal transduction histidine kinase